MIENINDVDKAIIESLKHTIEVLNQEKVAAENRLKYEKNKYEKQYKTLAIGLSDRLEHDIGLEILGIEDVISDITDRERTMIKRRINNIKAIISELGEKII
jgi:PDZ domain-containing secreted protein